MPRTRNRSSYPMNMGESEERSTTAPYKGDSATDNYTHDPDYHIGHGMNDRGRAHRDEPSNQANLEEARKEGLNERKPI